MRPLDLLIIRVDDEHKKFIRDHYTEDNNIRIPKKFELYSWGNTENFLLGYPSNSDYRKIPAKINVALDESSIIDIAMSETYCLCLTNTRELFSWGLAIGGHLGTGEG